MKFSEKLLKNYECKKMTVVRREDGFYSIFNTLDDYGHLRWSGVCDSIEDALKRIGSEEGLSWGAVDDISERQSWQIIKTIDFSELGGKGYQKGDKIRRIKTGQIGVVAFVDEHGVGTCCKDQYGNDENGYLPFSGVEPYFEDEDEEEEAERAANEVPKDVCERLDLIDQKIGIIFEELGITELKCGILSKKKS